MALVFTAHPSVCSSLDALILDADSAEFQLCSVVPYFQVNDQFK